MDIIPVNKATIDARNTIGTVTSHQWSSKERIPSTFTRTIEVITTIKKKAFSPTDHFPRIVFGAMSFCIFFSPNNCIVLKPLNLSLFESILDFLHTSHLIHKAGELPIF